MKQQNFLFVDIISSLFLLILLIGNFMGLLYITEGNLVISMLVSMFLVICYYFVVLLLKKKKEVMIKKKFLHPSLLFWVFFLLLGYASFNLMSHFINIEYNCKAKIKDDATQKIKLVDNLALEYKKRAKIDIDNFEAQLKTKLNEYKSSKNNINLRRELSSAKYQVDASVLNNPDFINVDSIANAKVTRYQLKINKNNDNIKKTIAVNSTKYQSVFNNWKRLSLMTTYSKLNEYVDESGKLINSKFEELPLDKTIIPLPPNKKLLPLNNPVELNKLFPPDYTFPLIIIVILHLFILIPFFTYKVRIGISTSKQKGTIEL